MRNRCALPCVGPVAKVREGSMIRKLGCWSLRLSIGVFIGAVVFPA
jgi:hypothetical protein